MRVPVIDLHSADAARAVDEAGRSVGFMQVVNHGLQLKPLFQAIDTLFALPIAEKLALRPPHAGINRGYAPMGSEALAYSLGVDAPLPDLFEAFNLGPEQVPDDPWYRQNDFFAPNLWPAVPSVRSAMDAYFLDAVQLALRLTDLFAVALALPDRFFRPFVDRSTLTLRCNYYGGAAPKAGQLRMGAHTDYGIVTVLAADRVPGLQILHDGAWHDVMPDEGALLVNLGDLTALWTNDRWRSTLHRVLPGGSTRRSAALFFDGNYDARIEPLPTCVSPENPARYAPVLAGDHLLAKVLGPRTLSRSSAFDTTGGRLA
ncbi:MAG TPA: 2OG-Fe(II) oxygenase family protein [Polyangiales bacterium]|nr:2OG-Fe(II) oxygenase family protein [Polyangiales bacterium]